MTTDIQERKAPPPIVTFKKNLDRLNESGELALPETVSFKAFKNAAVVAFTDNPEIRRCEPETLFKAIRVLAASGLVPDGREAAIVAFKGNAQAMPMVYGLIKVARNSGKITSLWADVVYEGEVLEVWIENGERKWAHHLTSGEKINAMTRSGKVIGAYAVAKMTDGGIEFQPMSFEEIESRRKASSNQRGAGPTGIWEKWYGEMAKKTVIRNLCKRLPMASEDMERLMAEETIEPVMQDVTPDEDRRTLADKILTPEDEPDGDPHDGPDEIEEAETINEEHWTARIDASSSFPGADEFTEGAKARVAGLKREMCPHEGDEAKAIDWLGGYDGAGEAGA